MEKLSQIPEKTRNETLDTVKFLLIFAIYVFHFGEAGGGLYLFFASYHVPAFFMVAGFWALNKIDRSVSAHIKNAFKTYMIPWLLWVCIYTAYHTVTNNFGAHATLDIFLKYLYSDRWSGIGGIWFIPTFFVVVILYFLIAKFVKKVTGEAKGLQSIINCIIAFAIYFFFEYFAPLPKGLMFSADHVPQFLFYYALGCALYSGYTALNSRPEMLRKTIIIISAAISVLYTVLNYYTYDDRLWAWVYEASFGYITIIPGIITVICALGANLCLAKLITCPATARIGRATLGLCLSEVLVKNILISLCNLAGLTLSVQTPFEAIIFALIALVFGCYLIVPAVNRILEKINSVFML